jgi:beta-glucosidase
MVGDEGRRAQTRFPAGSFPREFLWGVGASAYQIEGAVTADGRGPSIWDRFSHLPGTTVNGATGDVACDHYHRWPTDVAIMRELGVQAYRFSVSWPRVFPQGHGEVNPAGLDFYDRLTDALVAAGIEPWVCLYHWELPLPLQDAGGWRVRATADAHTALTTAVARRLGDRVRHWLTLNEPWSAAFQAHLEGIHAPGHHDLAEALAVGHTLLLAHGQAVAAIHQQRPDAQVGIAMHLDGVYPASEREEDAAAAHRYDAWRNRWFLDPLAGRGYPPALAARFGSAMPRISAGDLATIATPVDFLGVNYYTSVFARADPKNPPIGIERAAPPGASYTAMHQLIYPRGIYDVLMRVARDYHFATLYVTENGAAFDDPPPKHGRVADPERQRFLAEHVEQVRRALAAGVNLRGYFVWSLLDNFEWQLGYTKRFGLTYTDYQTLDRVIKDSGYWFGRLIAAQRAGAAGGPQKSPCTS